MCLKLAVCLLSIILVSTEGYIADEARNFKPRRLGYAQRRTLAGLTAYNEFKLDILNPIMRVRVPGTEGHHQVKTFIKEKFQKLKWNVTTDEFDSDTPVGQKHFTNIVATINPNAKRRLVIAAHYDSKFFLPTQDNDQFIGAIDSAVPCAIMIELAQTLSPYFAKLRQNSNTTLQMVFLDGEEAFREWNAQDSIYGARHLAEKWYNESQLGSVEAFILLDLLGAPSPTFFNMFSKTSHLFQTLQKIEDGLHSDGDLHGHYNWYFQHAGLQEGISIEDDHIPFLRKGVPILHLIPVPFPSCWHQFTDDRRCLNDDTIHNLIKIFRVFIAEYFELPVHV